jgi:cardiolipin synthase
MLSPKPSVLPWQKEQLFDDAELYFEALIAAILRAKQRICLEFYIFNYDNVGKRVIYALAQAIKSGVEVKVLIDGIGSSESGGEAAEQLELIGADVKIFHPLPWNISHYSRSIITGNVIYKALTFIRKINHRDHKKSCIIDGVSLWTGSLNISSQHLPLSKGGENWRDYGITVTGENIKSLENSFNEQWNKAELKTQSRRWRGQFRQYWNSFNSTVRKQKYYLLIDTIDQSQYRIWVTSAYFAPSSKIIRALKAASQRGVDVIIIAPRCSDVALFPYLTSSYYHGLVHTGIRIFEYRPSFLHAKSVIIDDLYLVGSSNFNHRSSLHDLELDIALTHPECKKQLENFMHQDIDNSQEITQTQIPYTLKHKILGYLTRAIRYWM